ncbi:MAG: DUF3445 domain-containing protein [Sulfitobacter sp.]|nr:DUF3445 domain-containing protein [Sulfitobacter sp.]
MTEILQIALPDEMHHPRPLPGVAPCAPDDWLRVDEVYGAQMAYKRRLLKEKGEAVLWSDPSALPAAQEMLAETLKLLPGLGFDLRDEAVHCPDGAQVHLNGADPLRTLGQLVQEDICILEKRGAEHVLTGAILCFPANWRLGDKAMRPLTGIHAPVEDYDDEVARRVQRLFDGVRAGRPLWRFNRLTYANPDLHQPTRRADRALHPFLRSERQCILRMPKTQAVIFTIHTFVMDRARAEAEAAAR